VKGAAVAEQHFNPAVLGAKPIAREKRHRGWCGFGLAVALEHGSAVHERHMRGRIAGRSFLSACDGGRRRKEHGHAEDGGEA
jgi:hypothetical protein